LRAVSVRVQMCDKTLCELDRRRVIGRAKADRISCHGGNGRISVQDTLGVCANGW